MLNDGERVSVCNGVLINCCWLGIQTATTNIEHCTKLAGSIRLKARLVCEVASVEVFLSSRSFCSASRNDRSELDYFEWYAFCLTSSDLGKITTPNVRTHILNCYEMPLEEQRPL